MFPRCTRRARARCQRTRGRETPACGSFPGFKGSVLPRPPHKALACSGVAWRTQDRASHPPGPASRTPGVWHWEGEDSHVSPRPALQDEVAPSLAKEMTAERHPGLPRGGRAGGGTPRTDAWAGRGCAPQPAGPRGPAACVLSDDFHPPMALRLQKDVFKDSPPLFLLWP